VTFDGNRPHQGCFSKPRADPVGENGEAFIIGVPFAAEIALMNLESRRFEHRKPHQLETEAGIDLIRIRRQLFPEKLLHQERLTQGPRGGYDAAAHRAIDPEQGELQDPRSFASPFEIGLQRPSEQEHQSFDFLGHDDRFGQMPLDGQRRHRQARRNRFLQPAPRLVEPDQQRRTEAADERRARRSNNRADGTQSDAFEAGANGRLQPQRRQR
jgi:hypothetical protein